MTALIAVDPGEAVLRIAAFDEPPDDVLLDAAPEPAARPQFRRMPGGALVSGTMNGDFVRSIAPG